MEGELVALKRVSRKGESRKLAPKYTGPWRVTKRAGMVTYEITRVPGGKVCTVHVRNLKPFFERKTGNIPELTKQTTENNSSLDPDHPVVAARASRQATRPTPTTSANQDGAEPEDGVATPRPPASKDTARTPGGTPPPDTAESAGQPEAGSGPHPRGTRTGGERSQESAAVRDSQAAVRDSSGPRKVWPEDRRPRGTGPEGGATGNAASTANSTRPALVDNNAGRVGSPSSPAAKGVVSPTQRGKGPGLWAPKRKNCKGTGATPAPHAYNLRRRQPPAKIYLRD
jgi:hypothetical protein